MPVIVDPDNSTVAHLLGALPPGSHFVESPERLQAWLGQHSEEYVVVLGPGLGFDEALTTCETLRVTRPTVSVVLLRDSPDTETFTRAMQAGARDVVPDKDLDALSGAVARAHQLWVALRGPSGAPHSGKVVTVFSPKGGVGKTTIAVNLALALADKGARKVCLVDLDLGFGDVAITMQLFPSHSIEHAIGSEDSLDYPMLESLLTRHPDSLMVLAAPSHPDVRDRVTPALVSRVLRILRDAYDYVVVDTAPAFDEQTLTALDETDECVIVATLDVPTLKNVKVACETLEMLNVARGHRYLLLNRADDAVGISVDKVEAILGMDVTTRLETSLDIPAATNAGTPILVGSPDHPSSVAFRALAEELVGEPIAPTAHRTAPRAPQGEIEKPGRRFRIRR